MLHLLKLIDKEIEYVNNEYEGELSNQDKAFIEGMENVKTMIENRKGKNVAYEILHPIKL